MPLKKASITHGHAHSGLTLAVVIAWQILHERLFIQNVCKNMTSSILLYSIICKYIHLRKNDKSRLICLNELELVGF